MKRALTGSPPVRLFNRDSFHLLLSSISEATTETCALESCKARLDDVRIGMPGILLNLQSCILPGS